MMKCRLFTVCIFTLFYLACGQKKKVPVTSVHSYVTDGIDSLYDWMDMDFIPLVNSSTDSNLLREHFFRGRELYKRVEFAVEYFFSNAARSINGPPLPEIETEEHIVLEPGGFQVIEEFLFPMRLEHRSDLIVEAQKFKSILVRVKTLWEGTQLRDDQVFDAIRFECFRLLCLGITGFDTPLSLHGIHEIPATLETVQSVVSFYANRHHKGFQEIQQLIQRAIVYARQNDDFANFDRSYFIRELINPVTTKLLGLQIDLQIQRISDNYALRSDIQTIFDSAAFNVNYFAPDGNSFATTSNISLGRQLFNDPVLSDNRKISCASCHFPEKAFTDGFVKSKALGSTGLLARNTPSLINAGLQKAQFYDMRATFLEDQVRNVIENKDEIHGSLSEAAKKLNRDSQYVKAFQKAFPYATEGISERLIQIALSGYIRSLTSFNSRFDRYMRGDSSTMNGTEINGFNLFMGKAKCGTCHFMPLFNGTVPPTFTSSESEVIGVPETKEGKKLDSDPGRFGVYEIDNLKNAFKTPSIRNIAVTAPYMHNGVFATLEEVVDFYDKGGGKGIGLNVENQTLPGDSLALTETEKKALIAFMRSLTDSSFVTHREIFPAKL